MRTPGESRDVAAEALALRESELLRVPLELRGARGLRGARELCGARELRGPLELRGARGLREGVALREERGLAVVWRAPVLREVCACCDFFDAMAPLSHKRNPRLSSCALGHSMKAGEEL